METGRSADPNRDVVVCADVLGSFGVTPADIRAQRREYRTTVPPGGAGTDASLETILTDVLADARDRTAMARQTICRSDRGLTCSARYAQTALGRELETVFETIGWLFEWTRTGPASNGRDRLELAATDPRGRRRETTVTYPTTPLANDNLPAVVHAINDRLLDGTDATFVLLSAGVDRWRAALVEQGELEALRDRYGPRISAFDRPLLPKDNLETYVLADDSSGSDSMDIAEGPWPAWALERAERRSDGSGSVSNTVKAEPASVASLIDEAEPEPDAGETRVDETATNTAESTAEVPPEPSAKSSESAVSARLARSAGSANSASSANSTTTAPASDTDGFEIRGGSPSVSRVSNDDDSSAKSVNQSDDSSLETRRRQSDDSSHDTGVDHDAQRGHSRDGESDDTGFGTLSGSQKTARVTNDSFGTDDEFETENDRYRALGAALGAGGAITVEGLLEDDEFIPELPAVESRSVRIEFADEFDPAAVSEAKASAEQSGFEWVDSGSLETTRLSNG